MKFAHLADSHLGYRQFNLIKREDDFYQVFDDAINKIIEEDVDFVIHSGDLFNIPKPTPVALLTFQNALTKLQNAGIPMYIVAGNHDIVMLKNDLAPHVLFENIGLNIIDEDNPYFIFEDILIAGIPFHPYSKIDSMKKQLKKLSDISEDYEKSILVLHQGIKEFFGLAYEIEIEDLPKNFNYYALGHIHNYMVSDYGDGMIVYPGSSEVNSRTELWDYEKNGKGLVIVDLDNSKPSIKRIKIKLNRDFVVKEVNYNTLEMDIQLIKNGLDSLDSKPIIYLDVLNVKSNQRAYEIINDMLKDYALTIKTKFYAPGEEKGDSGTLDTDSLNPINLIKSNLSKYDENTINLCIDLYNSLSRKEMDRAKSIADEFFIKNYSEELK